MNFLIKNCSSFAEKKISKNLTKNTILAQESKIIASNITTTHSNQTSFQLLSKEFLNSKNSIKNIQFNKGSANKLFVKQIESRQPKDTLTRNTQFQKMFEQKNYSPLSNLKKQKQLITKQATQQAIALSFMKQNTNLFTTQKIAQNCPNAKYISSQFKEKINFALQNLSQKYNFTNIMGAFTALSAQIQLNKEQQMQLIEGFQSNNYNLQYSHGSTAAAVKVNFDKTYRDKVLGLYQKHIFPTKPQMENHVLATEAIMGSLFDVLKQNGQNITESKDEWIAAGLLHDVDHLHDTAHDTKGNCKIQDLVKEAGINVTESMLYTISSHEGKKEPKSLMNWALYLSDDISWYILFNASQRGDKNLYNVKPAEIAQYIKEIISGNQQVPDKAPKPFIERQKKKLPEMVNCKEKLGIDFDTFVKASVVAMQQLQGRITL